MTTQPSEGYTCMDCLSAEAVIAIDDGQCGLHHMCEQCVRRITNDYMLDLVLDGELTVNADGCFDTTPRFHARLASESGPRPD